MKDSSFHKGTLEREIRKKDVHDNPLLKDDLLKSHVINNAVESANQLFLGRNPLVYFNRAGKRIYTVKLLSDELVIRKVCRNLISAARVKQQNRDAIVSNISKLIAEGLPFRVYRLDIKAFYESFSSSYVKREVGNLESLNPLSKKLIFQLIDKLYELGGAGLPRGLSISAALSEFLMKDFDKKISSKLGVFFYARYVDDILIITNGLENKTTFKKLIASELPEGLSLNPSKLNIRTCNTKVSPIGSLPTPVILSFNYLGYSFIISEPKKDKLLKPGQHYRHLIVDISDNKIKKIKFRIARAFNDFGNSGNYDLLLKRVKFLTTNYQIKDASLEKTKMAGIYYSYPMLTLNGAKGLGSLDNFLRNAVFSRSGRIFSKSSRRLTADRQKKLLGQSFTKGYKSRCILHFPPTLIREIQECWINE